MLLYVGVSYSRLHETSPGRRNAVDKQICVENAGLHSFGHQWVWQVLRRFDLRRTPNQLFLCDGEDGLLRLPRRYFKQALIQLDRFHVHRQLGRAFGLDTPGYRTALRALCRGNLGQVRSLLALRGVGSRRAICHEVRGYLDRQCLDRRIPDKSTLVREVGAWESERNAARKPVDWRFTTDNARIKLKRLYPQIQE